MSLPIELFFKPTEKPNRNNDNNANQPSSSNFVNRTVNSNHVNITEKPKSAGKPSLHQTPDNFIFPKALFGNRERQCQPQWLKTFPWLHYGVKKDRAFLSFLYLTRG